MSERPYQSSKGKEMSIEQQTRAMLWAAVPPLPDDNRKSWLVRAARTLGWKYRRTKALFYLEARVVTADEWKTLNERLNAAKQRERQQEERRYGQHRATHRGLGEGLPMDARDDPSLPLAAAPGAPRPASGRKARRSPAEL